ncbi:restriction endonuclease [Symmachiella dynata]|uniref:restriction endonuclease n=1 Tax=Symmachiella dynata TaxID=2527995 RepID=UPI0030EBCB72
MTVWLVRAGRNGEQEQVALDNNLVAIGWQKLSDLSAIDSREKLAELYENVFPDASPKRASNQVGQVWAFRGRMKTDDMVVLPLKMQASIAVGTITGPYKYRTDLGENIRHVRSVKWIKTDVPRTAFDQDLLHSFGAFMTVCQIQRNNAEDRIRAIVTGKAPPVVKPNGGDDVVDGTEENIDIDQLAQDQILEHIKQKFSGHGLADLVDAVLQSQGYLTRVSPPGPDGGVDILAGTGPMGFSSPRLCVQVKSSSSPADVNVLRGLQGILANFQANQGLLVSWGGFTKSVIQEARQNFLRFAFGTLATFYGRSSRTMTSFRISCRRSCH